MNDMNRLLIFLLLIGLLYAIYRYQHVIFPTKETFETVKSDTSQPIKKIKGNREKTTKEKVTIDNISQMSIGSLESKNNLYKQDSVLGSIDSGSLNLSEHSEQTNGSMNSFFFNR